MHFGHLRLLPFRRYCGWFASVTVTRPVTRMQGVGRKNSPARPRSPALGKGCAPPPGCYSERNRLRPGLKREDPAASDGSRGRKRSGAFECILPETRPPKQGRRSCQEALSHSRMEARLHGFLAGAVLGLRDRLHRTAKVQGLHLGRRRSIASNPARTEDARMLCTQPAAARGEDRDRDLARALLTIPSVPIGTPPAAERRAPTACFPPPASAPNLTLESNGRPANHTNQRLPLELL